MNDERSDTTGVRYAITLVHGTWAKNAAWVEPGSALSRALQERFGEGIELFQFKWTGGNSHSARRQATEELKKELAQRLRHCNTRVRQYLICHSHGGNVAISALADVGLQEKIAGVVCLATPFLVARERDLGRNPLKHLAGALVVVMLSTMWIAEKLLPTWWPAVGRFAAVVLVASLVMGAFTVLVKQWRGYAERLRSELAPPEIERERLLIVRSPADEASGALALFQFISQLSVRLILWSQSLYERYENAANRWAKRKGKMLALAAGALVTYVVFVIVAVSLPWESGFGSWFNVAALVGAFISLLFVLESLLLALGWVEIATVFFRLAASAVVWPVIFLLSVLLLPFGREMAVANILLDVTAETTPPGSWTVHLIAPPTSEELGKDVLPLMHSVVYENPSVLKLVCDWIASGGGEVMNGQKAIDTARLTKSENS